ncbi:cytochrome P450 [Nucisporomicrobium flavum]|uniref:cytochrome P450 n=1 Tax=Nucisporomicrobium flavum TaxID=2785915 RepID=UPI0018F62963|nr:cytochrome P450 [Nucisporomicrobium flavum]
MVVRQVTPDLADPAFWRLAPEQRLAAYRILRGLGAPARSSDGSYVLARHRDVVEASRRPDVFLSGPGVTTPRPPAWVRTVFGDSMVNMDDPRHARLRGVVSRAFTPRVLARISADVDRIARGIVADVVAERPTEFVAAVATRMPFEVICTMMGVPDAYRRELLAEIGRATEGTTVRRGLRVPGRGLRALARMHCVIARVARERRREPTDDLISALAAADLTGRELGAFFSLLMVAGVETTRNAVAHGLHLLSENPDQRALLAGDAARYAPGFVDEVVRHSSPIVQFRRTLARDHELGGRLLPAGADVVLCYASANRDESVFADPDRFDLTRHPNPHVGFGGGGPHFCLGTALARQEMTALFRELLTRLPDLRSVGEPVLVPSSFDNRVGRLSFTY